MKKFFCFLLIIASFITYCSVFDVAAGEVPLSVRVDVSKRSCSAVDSISVKAVVKNNSDKSVNNIVVSAFESKNLVWFIQTENCVTVFGPSGKALETAKQAKISSLKPGYSFAYNFNVMIDSSSARGKLSESDMKALETRAVRKNTKPFTTIYPVTGSGLSSSCALDFGGVSAELKVGVYYDLTKTNFDTVTQKQKPPETTAKAVQKTTKKASKAATTAKPKQESKPKSKIISQVPFLNQIELGYPNGCEATSAAMVLRYYGYDVTVADVNAETPKVSKFYQKNGVWYGGDPFKGFVGNPKKGGKDGAYGCFAPPIVKAMKSFAGDRVKNISGCSADTLFNYIAKGKPVVVWGSSGDNLVNGVTWKIVDNKGNVSDKTFTRIVHEHCMVLIGYDDNYVYLNNPSMGAGFKQSKAVFIKNFKILYSQAIIIE